MTRHVTMNTQLQAIAYKWSVFETPVNASASARSNTESDAEVNCSLITFYHDELCTYVVAILNTVIRLFFIYLNFG